MLEIFGTIFMITYPLSIGYNTIKLHKIRKEIIQKCKERLAEFGYQVNPKKIKYILEYTSTKTVDDIGYIMLSYMPFGSYFISYKIAKGKIEKEYNAVSTNILSYESQKNLANAGIIPTRNVITCDSAFSELPQCMMESFHRRYSPNPCFMQTTERLIDGIPSSEELSMEEINRGLDKNIEESKEKVLKKEIK